MFCSVEEHIHNNPTGYNFYQDDNLYYFVILADEEFLHNLKAKFIIQNLRYEKIKVSLT